MKTTISNTEAWHDTNAYDETNIQFLTRLMEYSKNGAMMQLFVLDAIGKQADYILEHEDQVRKEFEGTMFSAEAWIRTAREFKEEYDAKY